MIFIDADWKGLGGPQRVGVARTSTVRGRETLAFSFDPEWLPQRGGILLDPLLLATTGWHYPAPGGMPGILHDSAPDRWGRILMRRRETENARRERRPERSLTDTDSRCGLLTTEARSESFSRHGRTFLIRRFDREGPARIHFASARCLLATYRDHIDGPGV